MHRHRLERTRRAQGANVVDDVGAEVERRPHDFGLGGVDRDGAAEADRRAQHRQHPRELGLEVDRIGPGAARFAAQVEDVGAFLGERVGAVEAAGVARERIVVDPGVGFGKTPAQNLELLSRQQELLALGVPILAGWSRKSTLARLAGVWDTAPADRTPAQQARLAAASVAASLLAVQRGARIVRVHDVAATVAGLAVWKAAPAVRR